MKIESDNARDGALSVFFSNGSANKIKGCQNPKFSEKFKNFKFSYR